MPKEMPGKIFVRWADSKAKNLPLNRAFPKGMMLHAGKPPTVVQFRPLQLQRFMELYENKLRPELLELGKVPGLVERDQTIKETIPADAEMLTDVRRLVEAGMVENAASILQEWYANLTGGQDVQVDEQTTEAEELVADSVTGEPTEDFFGDDGVPDGRRG